MRFADRLHFSQVILGTFRGKQFMRSKDVNEQRIAVMIHYSLE